ncbi:MAG TPA: hypothetical protein VHR42_05510 [Clostridia bacterium]|nr:hypothetical protein [Clostridia bacterium]
MKSQINKDGSKFGKRAAVLFLFTMSLAITLSGIIFSFYALLNQISFRVANMEVSGVLFGLLTFYLGIRYLMSVIHLQKEIERTHSKFSWKNFKKRHSAGV